MSLADLKQKKQDLQHISVWLDHIQEFDPACRNEVMQHCEQDKEAREYYMKRYESDCK
jgi:hypothetical protein